MSFIENLNKILDKYTELAERLNEGLAGEELVKTSKEYSDLGETVIRITDYKKALIELTEAEELRQEPDLDRDTIKMIEDEIETLRSKIGELEKRVKLAIIPKDEADDKGAIIEVRAGTGGDEAALFASDLFAMYHKYSELRGWKFEILSISDTGIGGYKEAAAAVHGKGVFARLKFESGVHRVQRVPTTEASGRVHTSAATVAVLPEVEEVDIKIDEKDLKIDTYRSSGAGGQHVNTTDSAVRITHLPTGIVVCVQDERSQQQNRAKALKILRARVYDGERKERQNIRAAARKEQIGSGDRSERIRTYNFPQSRVSDHRINMTLYKIDAIVREGKLDEIIEALIADDEIKKLTSGDSF
jgi:peptide chain release factor 1